MHDCYKYRDSSNIIRYENKSNQRQQQVRRQSLFYVNHLRKNMTMYVFLQTTSVSSKDHAQLTVFDIFLLLGKTCTVLLWFFVLRV